MNRVQAVLFNQAADEIAVALFLGKIDGRRIALFAAFDLAQIQGLAEMSRCAADQKDRVALTLEGGARHMAYVLDESDAADRGRRQNRLAIGFVVERAIARHDGEG